MQNEGRKILHSPDLKVSCTCVRVPVWRSHSESIMAECDQEVDLNEIRQALSHSEGVQLKDDPDQLIYPMPILTTNQDDVLLAVYVKTPPMNLVKRSVCSVQETRSEKELPATLSRF